MNTVVTSREAILAVSRKLIQTQGWGVVNIRAVARDCNISIGSVYNYFSSKTDLISAVVESVWCDIFHFPGGQGQFENFTDCIQWVFESMKRGDEKYPGFFNLHSMSFMGEEKTQGQQLMAQSWKHIQEGLFMVLKQDQKVRSGVFDESFTREKFVELIFSLIIAALLQQNYDCSGILGMVCRVLY